MNNFPLKEKKIFINNVNSWLANFIIEELRTEHITEPNAIKHSFMGTKNPNNPSPPPYLFEHEIIKIDYNFHYENKIFYNDIIIYDLADTDLNEVEYVIRGLKSLKYEQDKILILISNIMTWARTPPKIRKEDEPQDEDPSLDSEDKNILPFVEEDKVTRIPARKFLNYKIVETLAFAAMNTNPNLKAYVICPGLLYGYGEDVFYEYFKMCWTQQPKEIPILGEGKNLIPTIHVRDLVSLVKRIIDTKPNRHYIFAVDRTRNKSLLNIVSSMSKNIGNGQIRSTENYQEVPNFSEFLLNLKIKTSKIFEDVRRENESMDAFNRRKFQWHCEFGIPENCEKLRQEFALYRNLKSMKIFITGPPVSGKTFLGSRISKLYNIPHIRVTDLVEIAKRLMNTEGDVFGNEIHTRVEELIEKEYQIKEQENLKKNKNKRTYVPTDRNSIAVRIPDDILHKICKMKLNENICRNNGFVLDGYPRSYKDGKDIFLDKNPNEMFFTEEDKNNEDKYLVNNNILPGNIITWGDFTDDFLKHRMKAMPEEEKKDSHYTDEGFNRRMVLYKATNETQNLPSVQDFFKKYKSTYLALDCKLNENELIGKIRGFFEKDGPINSMKISDESHKEGKSIITQNESQLGLDKEKPTKTIKETVESELLEEKRNAERLKSVRKKLDELKERERQILETKSQVLRQYLAENVIPYLAQGILEICQTLPEDPVQTLSDFLLEKSLELKKQNASQK